MVYSNSHRSRDLSDVNIPLFFLLITWGGVCNMQSANFKVTAVQNITHYLNFIKTFSKGAD